MEIIDYLYEKYLRAFYKKEGLDEKRLELATKIVTSNSMKKYGIDVRSFKTNFSLWHKLNGDPQPDIYFPLPACKRILPYLNSYWNATKSPSDTTTKLLDSCSPSLGIKTSDTAATARMILLFQILNFRLVQMYGSKHRKNAYMSLYKYRNAASHRCTLCGSIDMNKDHIRRIFKFKKANNAFVTTPNARVLSEVRDVFYTTKKNVPTISYGITPGKHKRDDDMKKLCEMRNKCCLGISLVSVCKVVDEEKGKFKKSHRYKCALCGDNTSFLLYWLQ